MVGRTTDPSCSSIPILNPDTGELAMVASTVSSKMVEAMAKVEGFRFVESLTGMSNIIVELSHAHSSQGFKYIGNTALNLMREGYRVPFGYEEAIGFMLNTGIRDKDGVAATVSMAYHYCAPRYFVNQLQVFFAEMATWLDSQSSSAAAFLDELHEKYVLKSPLSFGVKTQNLLQY